MSRPATAYPESVNLVSPEVCDSGVLVLFACVGFRLAAAIDEIYRNQGRVGEKPRPESSVRASGLQSRPGTGAPLAVG